MNDDGFSKFSSLSLKAETYPINPPPLSFCYIYLCLKPNLFWSTVSFFIRLRQKIMEYYPYPSRFSMPLLPSFGDFVGKVKEVCNFAVSAIIGNIFSAIFTFFFALGLSYIFILRFSLPLSGYPLEFFLLIKYVDWMGFWCLDLFYVFWYKFCFGFFFNYWYFLGFAVLLCSIVSFNSRYKILICLFKEKQRSVCENDMNIIMYEEVSV